MTAKEVAHNLIYEAEYSYNINLTMKYIFENMEGFEKISLKEAANVAMAYLGTMYDDCYYYDEEVGETCVKILNLYAWETRGTKL